MNRLARWQPAEVWRKTGNPATFAPMTRVFTGKMRLTFKRTAAIDVVGAAHIATETYVRVPRGFSLQLLDEIYFTELDKTFLVDEVDVRGAVLSETRKGRRSE